MKKCFFACGAGNLFQHYSPNGRKLGKQLFRVLKHGEILYYLREYTTSENLMITDFGSTARRGHGTPHQRDRRWLHRSTGNEISAGPKMGRKSLQEEFGHVFVRFTLFIQASRSIWSRFCRDNEIFDGTTSCMPGCTSWVGYGNRCGQDAQS